MLNISFLGLRISFTDVRCSITMAQPPSMILNLTSRKVPGITDLAPYMRSELLDALGKVQADNSAQAVRSASVIVELALCNGLGHDRRPDPVPQAVLLDPLHPTTSRLTQEFAIRGIQVMLAAPNGSESRQPGEAVCV